MLQSKSKLVQTCTGRRHKQTIKKSHSSRHAAWLLLFVTSISKVIRSRGRDQNIKKRKDLESAKPSGIEESITLEAKLWNVTLLVLFIYFLELPFLITCCMAHRAAASLNETDPEEVSFSHLQATWAFWDH